MTSSALESEPTTLPASQPVESSPAPLKVIEPARGWQFLNAKELWRYRELLFFFTWRDVTIRYKQTLLGAAWAVIQPFMMMVVFTIFLGKMAGISSGEFPYPVFVYAGLLPWTFFATAITNAGNSVVNANQMISKIYFPRLIIPFSSVGAALADFGVAFLMLLGMMFYYQISPSWTILFVPLLLGLAMMTAIGVGTLLAALNVAYRDFKYVIPFLVQLWMFATPTVYMNLDDWDQRSKAPAVEATEVSPAGETNTQADGTPPLASWIIHLNPMTGLIGFFRAATLGGELPFAELAYSILLILILFVVGIAYFRRVEATFADVI